MLYIHAIYVYIIYIYIHMYKYTYKYIRTNKHYVYMYTYMYVHLVFDICVNIESMIGKMVTPEGFWGSPWPAGILADRQETMVLQAPVSIGSSMKQWRNCTKIINNPLAIEFPYCNIAFSLFLPENEQIWIDPTYSNTKLVFLKVLFDTGGKWL